MNKQAFNWTVNQLLKMILDATHALRDFGCTNYKRNCTNCPFLEKEGYTCVIGKVENWIDYINNNREENNND